MGLFSFSVEVFDGRRRHTAGEFRRYEYAANTARRIADHKPGVLAVVNDRDGRMVYAADGVREWNAGELVR